MFFFELIMTFIKIHKVVGVFSVDFHPISD